MSGLAQSAPGVSGARACPECLRRTWLLERLAGHLDLVRERIDALLSLNDDELIAAIAGRDEDGIRREHAEFADRAVAPGERVCRCDAAYPSRLHDLPAPPAVLHVSGGIDRLSKLVGDDAVAVVGARRASPYGVTVAESLGRGLGVAEVPVVSGMALGIDSAAHRGVLEADGSTVAVVPAGIARPYPASAARLHRSIPHRGVLVSELGGAPDVRRWMFPARNRIIAALSAMTVVVQARAASGALLTARAAASLGRVVAAVPGDVGSPLSAGPHDLLRTGARLVAGPQDVLDELYGAGARSVADARRRELEPEQAALLEAIAEGHPTAAAFVQAGLDIDGGLAALASLELGGWVRRGMGGRFSVVL